MVQQHLSEAQSTFLETSQQERVPLLFFILFGFACMLVGFGSIITNITFLPVKLATFHSNSVFLYSIILALGALVAVVGNPLTGAFLDRSMMQKRQLCLAVTTVLLSYSFVLITNATSIIVLVIGIILAQLASAGILYSTLATMLLQVPLQQRAMASAFFGVFPLIGGVVGQLLYNQVFHTAMVTTGYVFSGITLVILVPFLLYSESFLSMKTSAVQMVARIQAPMAMLRAFSSNDFSWTWIARCLIFLAYTTVINYSTLFLGAQQQLFFAVSVVGIVIMAFVTGKLSDYFQRRKLFVIGASLLFGIGLGLLGFGWSVVGLVFASALFGLGYGAYQSSDLALATQVLPSQEEGGRDLGLMNAAVFLPMIVAPVIATIILTLFHSYIVLLLSISSRCMYCSSLYRQSKAYSVI